MELHQLERAIEAVIIGLVALLLVLPFVLLWRAICWATDWD